MPLLYAILLAHALICASLVVASSSPPSSSSCATDEDCGLLGDCIGSICVCDAGWMDPACATLDLVPSPPGAGLMQKNRTNWCGTIMPPAFAGDKYRMLASDMCNLGLWLSGSQVIETVSTTDSPLGPYEPTGAVAVYSEAHNPSVLQAPDGTFLLFDSYGGPDAGCPGTGNASDHCANGPMCPPKMPKTGGLGNWTFHTSPSPSGPWTPYHTVVDFPCFSENLTPAPRYHPNGTLFIVFHCDSGGNHSMGDLVMVQAPTWRGPFARVNDGVWKVDASPHPEDPNFWLRTSPTTGLTSFHVILHNTPVGIHLYSADGLYFTLQQAMVGSNPIAPFVYNQTINQTDGSAFECVRRERPWLLFTNASSSVPIALVTAVQASIWPSQFTHIQAINSATSR